jgi:GntR family transcriptional repressor for pyruvate dehydrogenase complex
MNMSKKKTYELVAEHIQGLIADGKLKPGDRLDTVAQFAKSLQVSRSAVREALSALSLMGYIELRQGEGTFVKGSGPIAMSQEAVSQAPLNLQQIKDFFELRKILESGAVMLACERRSATDLKKLKSALLQMAQSLGDKKLSEEADVTFHIAIAEATKNGTLIATMNHISDSLKKTMLETKRVQLFSLKETLQRLYAEHQAIYQAIEDQNGPLAQQLMLSHLNKVEDALLLHFG